MPKRKEPRWEASKSASANGRRALPSLTTRYLRAGRALLDRDASLKDLHKFRLKTKKFRYLLELFRPCYGAPVDRRLEVLRRTQQHLGAINDCKVTRRLLLGRSRPRTGHLAGLAKFLDVRVAENTQRLVRVLRQSLRGHQRKAWWVGYLTAARGSAVKKAPKRALQARRRDDSESPEALALSQRLNRSVIPS